MKLAGDRQADECDDALEQREETERTGQLLDAE